MDDHHPYFESNRKIWNQRTAVHKDSVFYDLASFKKGRNSLAAIELGEIGDVGGKSLLHLQCHFGMDTMSLSRMGARSTGIDLSDEAIRLAGGINEELKLDAEFVCCNVYDLLSENPVRPEDPGLQKVRETRFDMVFTSYGVIGWLPDLVLWGKLIQERLKPGGFFYIAEFHPVVWMFDEEFTYIKYPYDNRELIVTENEGTYTDRQADIRGKEYSWNHSISELLNALIGAGLQIEFFNEHMFSPYPCFRNVVEAGPDKWHIKGLEGKIPMVFSLKATKPADT